MAGFEVVAVEKVGKRFGAVTALDEVGFVVNGPGVLGILGPNGAGKTTLLEILEGLAQPDTGSVRLFGEPLSRRRYPRRRVGVVLQKESALERMTVKDYSELFGAIYAVDAGAIVSGAKLVGREDALVEKLSGGEAQRLFIAAASAHRPDLFIVDEPTAHLDPESKRAIGDELAAMGRERRVLLTTHDLGEAQRLCDEVLFLVGGQVRARGSVAELGSLKEAFFRLCGSRIESARGALVKPLLLLVGFRLRDAVGTVSSALVHFGLPLMLLVVTGLLFASGHPFERRRLEVLGAPPLSELAKLEGLADLRVVKVADRDRARARLQHRNSTALLDWDARRLHVGAGDPLVGRGLAQLLGPQVTMTVEPTVRFAYLRTLFPGLLTWTIVVNGLLGMGYSMAYYRRTHFLTKLATTPLSRYTFVGAQILWRACLSFAQLVLMLGLAALLLGLRPSPAGLVWMVALTIVGVLAFTGWGFALAAAIENEVNLTDLANALTVVIVLLSGFFFPVDELPAPVARVAELLPSTQLTDLFREALLHGSVRPMGLVLLAGWAIAAYGVSLLTFRWQVR